MQAPPAELTKQIEMVLHEQQGPCQEFPAAVLLSARGKLLQPKNIRKDGQADGMGWGEIG